VIGFFFLLEDHPFLLEHHTSLGSQIELVVEGVSPFFFLFFGKLDGLSLQDRFPLSFVDVLFVQISRSRHSVTFFHRGHFSRAPP